MSKEKKNIEIKDSKDLNKEKDLRDTNDVSQDVPPKDIDESTEEIESLNKKIGDFEKEVDEKISRV